MSPVPQEMASWFGRSGIDKYLSSRTCTLAKSTAADQTPDACYKSGWPRVLTGATDRDGKLVDGEHMEYS